MDVNLVSTLPIKEYDIVSDIWNLQVKIIIGELLANLHYRTELLAAINTMENQEKRNLVNKIRGNTIALNMKVRINGQKINVISNSGTVVSIISKTQAN